MAVRIRNTAGGGRLAEEAGRLMDLGLGLKIFFVQRRCDVGELFEHPDKAAGVVEPDLARYQGNGEVLFCEQFLCLLYFRGVYEMHGIEPRVILEKPAEMVFAEMGLLREMIEAEGSAQVVFDEIDDREHVGRHVGRFGLHADKILRGFVDL